MALGQLAKKRKRCTPGSRRSRKLWAARYSVSARKRRQIRDLRQKGTRKVITFCQEQGVGRLFIGNPHGVRKRNSGRHHNQRLSAWEYGQDIAYLSYKSKLASTRSFDFERAGNIEKVAGRAAGNRKCRGVTGAAAIPTVRFKGIGMWSAASTCTRSPLGPGSPFPLASRINEPAP